ncbi:MAG: IPT/TIG domain-containing protein [Sedimentisphaerales bacterium]|nr:IPT/TIG domain-containing protein [Sedimentisphaerales bacterium]
MTGRKPIWQASQTALLASVVLLVSPAFAGRFYATRPEAVLHVRDDASGYIQPQECFIWKDGDPDTPWRVIPGTGCAHWVAHQLGLGVLPSPWQQWETGHIEPPLPEEAWDVCYDGYYINVTTLVEGLEEIEREKVIVGDVWTQSDLGHCGIVREVTSQGCLVEHCSVTGIAKNWKSSGRYWRVRRFWPSLQSVLDNITVAPVAGDSSIDVRSDYLPDGGDSLWSIGGSGGSWTALVFEQASSAADTAFGVYDAEDASKTVELFAGADGSGAQVCFSILVQGNVLINPLSDTGIRFSGNRFGYYLDYGDKRFYSEARLNHDGIDHMYAYQGTGDTIELPGQGPGLCGTEEYVLAFVDTQAQSDQEFLHFVCIVESVAPASASTPDEPPPPAQTEPYLDTIAPDSGAPGIIATIRGSSLDKVTEHVKFDTVEAEIVSWSTSTVVVKVPEPRSEGERTVDVTAGGGIGLEETNSVPFTYKKPVLESVLPSYGKPGDEITFTGKHFGEVQHSVEFGRSLVSPESHGDTEMVAKAPWDLGFGVGEWVFVQLVKCVANGVIPGSGELLDLVYEMEAGGVEIDWSGGDIDVEARARSAVGRSDPKRFTFNIYEVIEMVIGSPGEPRIVDAEGNVTGVVDGNVRREIPYSYFAEDTALIVNPESSYTFEVVGTGQGTYGLQISRINRNSPQEFEANGILIAPGSRHVFEINWDSGAPSTTLKVDTEGDGRFEQTITASDSLETPQISVNSFVTVAAGAASYDRRTGQFSVGVTVKNTSSTVIGEPVWLVIDSVSSFWVVPANTSGTTEDGKPYVDLTPLLGDGDLDPGETVQTRAYFTNPQRARFTFAPGVRGCPAGLSVQ